jgi:F0F1-type ATP synthase delta subunit
MRDICARPEFKNNSEALRMFFHDVKDTLDAFVLLKLTIAFKPSEEMINRLHEWTRQNLGAGAVLDIGYDASILGGVRVIFSGRYKEMTLAQMITDAMVKEKKIIMGMIK